MFYFPVFQSNIILTTNTALQDFRVIYPEYLVQPAHCHGSKEKRKEDDLNYLISHKIVICLLVFLK